MAGDPKRRCIHELFEAQVRRTPGAIAVESAPGAITYTELNDRANRFARRLQQEGVGPEVVVGLCLERSIEMLVGILGILKAGGAYLPLDPGHPSHRLGLVLDDAQASLVVTRHTLADVLPSEGRQSRSVVCIESSARQDAANLAPTAGPGNLAYVMYTSGSTGVPKGVMVTHRNVVHSTTARLAFYKDPIDRLLLLPPVTFDASVAAIFWTLSSGGCLVLPPAMADHDPLQIARSLSHHKPSHVLCAAPLYDVILELSTPGDLASIRVAVVGGEACRPAMIARHREKAPAAGLFNEYGTTECTVWSSVKDVTDARDASSVSIGRPIADTELHVLDEDLKPLPPGIAGELFIGGNGVARGYLNRPDATAASFIPNPFSTEPGARLYRTGDRVVCRADGELDFLGRLDRQTKIRGVRVELEEIEAILAQHPSVRDAVVVADDAPGGARLLAYVVAHPRDVEDARPLVEFLGARLPEVMIPSRFTFLASLPRTATGKVDRLALPRLAQGPPTAKREALSLAEQEMQALWEEVLDVRPVRLDDNFFDLGGHSLVAAQLLARLTTLTGQSLPLGVLLEAGTIRQLTMAVRTARTATAHTAVVAVQREGSRPPLFCVPGTGQTALHYAPLARHLGTCQPLYALDTDAVRDSRLDCRLETVAAQLIEAMVKVQPAGPYHVAGNSFGGLVAFEIARQLRSAGRAVHLLALFDTAHPGTRALRYARLASRHLRSWKGEANKLAHLRTRAQTLLRLANRPARHEVHSGNEVPRSADGGYADLAAFLKYVPRAYSGHLTVFQALDRDDAPRPLLGWDHVTSSVEVHHVPGRHMTMLREPHVRFLAEQLATCLDRLDSAGPAALVV